MAITVEYLKELGVSEDIAKKIFEERGKEIQADKVKREKLEADLKESKKSLDTLTEKIDSLESTGKNAEELQAKLDAIIAERDAEKKQAEADRILKEKQENVANRFSAVLGDKKFSHSAIEAEYLKRFGEALESKDFEGKSDSDIFHELTKDDDSAFKGVSAVKLVGGKLTGAGAGKYSSREEIFKIRDAATRQNEMLNNPDLFPEIKG